MKATSIIDRKTPVVTCRRAEELLHDDLYGLDHEEAWVLYLSPRNTFIEKEMVSKGTLDKTAIDCRTILRQALLHNAASIIVLHNHPSGDPRPSKSDIFLTNKLRQACSLIAIKLIDHIIFGDEDFYSFDMEKTYRIIN